MFDYFGATQQALLDTFGLKSWTFVSFAHVSAVVSGLTPGGRVLSIGGGRSLSTDRLLALRYPHLAFTGTDLAPAEIPARWCPPNLEALALDVCQRTGDASFDLVYSVECFEHIPDDELAFANALTHLRPGGALLVIVPFAPPDWRDNEEALARESEAFGHVRTGYDAPRLLSLARLGRFGTATVESCYWSTTAKLRAFRDDLLGKLDAAAFAHLEALAMLDIRPGEIATSRGSALGLKLLAFGKESG